MHHPKPNKTGSLALRITHVYSIFAACVEGSSRAGAIENVRACVCVFPSASARFQEGALNVENRCQSHIGNLKGSFS